MIKNETASLDGPWRSHRIPQSAADPSRIPSSLFPHGIVFEQTDPALVSIADLYPAEALLVANAVQSRQREFAAGRLCAHRALERIGIPATPLLMNSDRRPAWPIDVVGSIAHTDGACGVAVARRESLSGIGFDVEPASPLPADVWHTILTDDERVALHRIPDPDRGVRARLIFSAKEAFYKCYCGTGGGWLDFHDLEIQFTAAGDAMDVRARKPLWRKAPIVEGRFGVTTDLIFTVFTAAGTLAL